MSSYVSDQLSHFVGAGKSTDEGRLNLLVNIINQGVLLDGKTLQRRRKSAVSFFDVATKNGGVERHNYFPQPYFDSDVTLPLDSNEFVQPDTVCFCDIPFEPIEFFRIHTGKYNRFGLAFRRIFLLRQGASPVFYIAKSAPTHLQLRGSAGPYADFYRDDSIPSLFGTRTRAEFFNALKERLLEVIDATGNITQEYLDQYQRGTSDPHEYKRRVFRSIDLPTALLPYLFGYTKFFDPELPDDDPENFYMEREWRVLGEVVFSLRDVTCIMLPPEYVSRFKSAVPNYSGPILELPRPGAV